jgi:hypothetical protein
VEDITRGLGWVAVRSEKGDEGKCVELIMIDSDKAQGWGLLVFDFASDYLPNLWIMVTDQKHAH